MKRQWMIWLLCCFISSSLGAQGFLKIDTTQYIEWNEERPLSWKDYLIKEDSRMDESYFALTSVIHSVRGGLKRNKPNFRVHVLYVKRDSWSTTDENQRLLAHEQLHFDLAELYGRKLKKEIASLGKQGTTDLKVYRKRIDLLLKEFKSKSLEYDDETMHGRLQDAQEIWVDYVRYELNRLEKYKK